MRPVTGAQYGSPGTVRPPATVDRPRPELCGSHLEKRVHYPGPHWEDEGTSDDTSARIASLKRDLEAIEVEFSRSSADQAALKELKSTVDNIRLSVDYSTFRDQLQAAGG